MALSASSVLEVRTGGSDTNGGGFVTGAAGADFSQQNSNNTTNQGTTTQGNNGGSIASGATSVILTALASLYGSQQALLANPLVGDWIKIDSEIMKVTAVSGNTATITRAQLGTSAASHTDGATVTNISNVSVTDLVTAGTTTLSSLTAFWSANAVGSIIYSQGGTGTITAGWYQIISVSTSGSSTTCVVDRSTGLTTGTGATMNIGGALLSPSIAVALLSIAGMTAFIKSGTYSITTNTVNTAGGNLQSLANGTYVVGYSTTRTVGNTDTQPVIQTNGSTITSVFNGFESFYINLTFDGNNQTSAKLTNGGVVFIYCTIKNYNTNSSAVSGFLSNIITANSAIVAIYGWFAYNEVYSNTSQAIRGGQTYACAFDNLIYSNSTAAGMAEVLNGLLLANNIAVANGAGIASTPSGNIVLNSVAESNTNNGFTGTAIGNLLIGSATYNNGTAISGTWRQIGTIANTVGSFFVNATGSNFLPNNLTNQGALLRQSGYFGYVKGLTPRGTTVALPDIGAAQSRVPWQTTNMQGGLIG